MMTSEFAIAIIGCLVIILVLSYLIKSFIKVVIVCIAIGILFNLGFVWGADDLNNKLGLRNFFTNDSSEKIQDGYGDYAQKRQENMIIDTNAIKQSVIEKGEGAVDKIKGQITNQNQAQNELDGLSNPSHNTTGNNE